MTTTKPLSPLNSALLLHQATPFQKIVHGKRDAISDFALECNFASEAKRTNDAPQKEENFSGLYKNVKNFPPCPAMSSQDTEQAATDLASLCFGMLLNTMFSSVKGEGGASGEMWRSMLVEQYGKFIAMSPAGRDLHHAIKERISTLQKDAANGDSRTNNARSNDQFNS
ncbi:MAG: hypothetical protein LBQ26_00010 [Holosporales bacterium]|jgi:cytochrome c-type biogenesis protein CcmH/NrfF|nr:hypothetical protein [Holosporales bacterium]